MIGTELSLLLGAVSIGLIIFLVVRGRVGLPSQEARLQNALLAEHALSLVELVPENAFAASLKNAVIASYRTSGFPEWSAERVAESFNDLSRIEQLNILALAFNELGHTPTLQNASWLPIKNPFGTDFDEGLVSSKSERLTQKFGVHIGLGTGRFRMTDWGIEDVQQPKNEATNHTDSSLTGFERRTFGPYTLESSFVREYPLQDHTAEFIYDPSFESPIEYLYALVVTRNSDGQVEFIVGAEKPFRFPDMPDRFDGEESAVEGFSSTAKSDNASPQSVVLGVLSSEGHVNFGSSPKWANPQLFIPAALRIARERLGIEDLRIDQVAKRSTTEGLTESVELVPGLTAPMVIGGSYVKSFQSNDYVATISEDNESVGPIEYKYVMVVTAKNGTSPVMFVTAEKNEMLPTMIETMPDEARQYFGNTVRNDLMLCFFDGDGHHNLGPDDAISSLEGFSHVARRLVEERLCLTDKFQEIVSRHPKRFGRVIVQAQNDFFETFGVTRPSDAEKLKASFYLCISGIAFLNDAGGGVPPGIIDDLVADTRELVKPLSVFVKDLFSSPEQLECILSQIPSGATGSTRLNGLAAFEAMYFSLGEQLVNEIVRHEKGPLGVLGYAGYIVAGRLFGESKAREKFLEVSKHMLSFAKALVNVA